jgi:alpha-tubulin suppressor-like RCC1 family protein
VTGIGAIVSLDGGMGHTCAVQEGGTVWCWGYNNLFQLGDGTSTNRSTPVQVAGLVGAASVSAGSQHTCTVKQDGTIWCWGYNLKGQLGDGTTSLCVTLPVKVEGVTDALTVSAAWDHTCATTASGTAWCWGGNYNGQLGDGTSANRLMAVPVAGLSNVVAIAAADDHTCALTDDGEIWCWGWGGVGQLGNGVVTVFPAPVPVVGWP